MKALIVAIPASLAAGFAIGGVIGNGEESGTADAPVAYIDASAPVEERLAALERIIEEERNARLVLEDQLNMIFEELDEYDEEISRGGPGEADGAEAVVIRQGRPGALSDTRPDASSREEMFRDQLVEGGFTENRADWIIERSAEFQWDAMQARYEARQNGEGFDWMTMNPAARLRAELGDVEYEQYLDATGQPSVVSVSSVMATSPAERVGLQAGDEIRSYNGQRIFNMNELQIATNTAAPGTNVVVEVMRNGSPMSVTIPAGPMGVQATASGRRTGWRRGN